MPRPLTLLQALGCLLLGAAVSLCTVLLHGYWWGLLLGLAASAATLVALPGGPCRLGFAAGWAILLGLASPLRPEGDYLVAGNASGNTLLASGIVVLVAGFIGLVRRPAPVEDSGEVRKRP